MPTIFHMAAGERVTRSDGAVIELLQSSPAIVTQAAPSHANTYRIMTDGLNYRIERLRPRWFGLWGPIVWRPINMTSFQNFAHAERQMEIIVRQREGWKPATRPDKPDFAPPGQDVPQFPANRIIREGDRPSRHS